MYVPSFNAFNDKQEQIMFMQRYSFAVLITVVNGLPVATHLPFIIKQENDKIILYAHFAKANPQAAQIDNCGALVIFSEPHAYVSPRYYEGPANVPTWNYIAVHVHGRCSLITGEAERAALLADTVLQYEAEYLSQWNSLPAQYQDKMVKGITAFKLEVTDIQAKKKLSQNRSATEQQNIINGLVASGNENEQTIAAYMAELKKPEDKSKTSLT